MYSSIETYDVHSRSLNCICTTNKHCESEYAIYEVDEYGFDYINPRIAYILPGIVSSCYLIDSLLHSTLQCFYSNSNCTSILINYIQQNNYRYNDYPKWIDIHPLQFNSTNTRFYPNTKIESIVKQVMIEQWNPSIRYDHYYEACAPTHCTYEDKTRTKSEIALIISLMSFIGGLCSSLNIISPYLVQFCYTLSMFRFRRQRRQHDAQQGQIHY